MSSRPPSARVRPGLGDPVRWARAAVTAGVALSLGSVAHTSAGGLLPSAPGLIVVAALGTLGCWWALAGPASTRRLVALVAAVQTLGHALLSALAGHTGAASAVSAALPAPRPDHPPAAWAGGPPDLDAGRRTGSLRDLTSLEVPTAGSGPELSPWLAHLLGELSGPQVAMALAHLVAAALLGAWLAVGEQALSTLVHLGGRGARAATATTIAALRDSHRWGVAVLVSLPAPAGRRTGSPCPASVVAPGPLAEVCRAVSRRGPPVGLVCS